MITKTEQALQTILKPGESAQWQRLPRPTLAGLFSGSFCWNCHRQTETIISPTERGICAKCGVEK